MTARKALLVLEDGRIFTGTEFGAVGETLGEAVFSTGMSGYQETLTDPSYHRQIVVATAPQIGNTGWNLEDGESRGDKIWVAGYAVRDPSPRASNWRATGTLEDELIRQGGIVGIAGIDTRAVVRHLRSRGSMKAGVFSGDALAGAEELVSRVRGQAAMLGADLAGEVSTHGSYVVEPEGRTGSPSPPSISVSRPTPPRNFTKRGVRTHVLPSSVSFGEIAGLHPDGVFLSNGPGGSGHRRPRGGGDPGGARRRNPAVRHLLRQPDPRPCAGPLHLQDDVRAPRHQHPGDGPRHGPGGDHRPESRLRPRGGGGRRGVRYAVRARDGEPHLRQRRCGRGGDQAGQRSGVLGAVSPPRRPLVPATPSTCSISSST